MKTVQPISVMHSKLRRLIQKVLAHGYSVQTVMKTFAEEFVLCKTCQAILLFLNYKMDKNVNFPGQIGTVKVFFHVYRQVLSEDFNLT